MFSNGHIMVMPFLQYDPNTNPKNSVHLVWKAGKVLMHSLECQFFGSFYILKWWNTKQVMMTAQKNHIRKYFACYIIF